MSIVLVAIALFIPTTSSVVAFAFAAALWIRIKWSGNGIGIVNPQTAIELHLLKLSHLPWFVYELGGDVFQLG